MERQKRVRQAEACLFTWYSADRALRVYSHLVTPGFAAVTPLCPLLAQAASLATFKTNGVS